MTPSPVLEAIGVLAIGAWVLGVTLSSIRAWMSYDKAESDSRYKRHDR